MIVEIINTGTELLLGQVVNTNASFLSKELNELGFDVLYHTTVGDNPERMGVALKVAMQRADIIITTGGLGPTLGDITKEVLCEQLNIAMELHQESVERIKKYFSKHSIVMPESNLRQAMMPKGAIVMDNDFGTAPSVLLRKEIEHKEKIFILLPGPPAEVKGVFLKKIKPYLKKHLPQESIILSKVLKVMGIGESLLEEKLKEFVVKQSNPTVAFLARPEGMLIRITAKEKTKDQAEKAVEKLATKIRTYIKDYIIAEDETTLAEIVFKLLQKKGYKLSLAESCTGGMLSSAFVDLSGSSEIFSGAVVAYDNTIKENILNVKKEFIENFGAVSKEVAEAMAVGVLNLFKTDVAVSVSGIAGPEGGTEKKPVGTYCVAIANQEKVFSFDFFVQGTRNQNRYKITQMSLNLLRKYLEDEGELFKN